MKKSELYNLINARQNFTYCKDQKRYVIGTTNVYTGKGIPSNINVTIQNSLLELKKSKQMTFGGWLDTETDLYYLDIGFSLNCKDTALALANSAKQICIYDSKENKTINTKK